MKNKKWLTYTLGILLTLVVLAMVGGAGFRFGMMQNVSNTRPAFTHNFDSNPQAMPAMPGNFQRNDGPQSMRENFQDHGKYQAMQGNSRNQGFNNRRDSRLPFLPPIFGLIHLAVLGLLIWIGYKIVKNSGWRLTRVQATPAPVASTTSGVEVGEQ
jgi:hypothetical protein